MTVRRGGGTSGKAQVSGHALRDGPARAGRRLRSSEGEGHGLRATWAGSRPSEAIYRGRQAWGCERKLEQEQRLPRDTEQRLLSSPSSLFLRRDRHSEAHDSSRTCRRDRRRCDEWPRSRRGGDLTVFEGVRDEGGTEFQRTPQRALATTHPPTHRDRDGNVRRHLGPSETGGRSRIQQRELRGSAELAAGDATDLHGTGGGAYRLSRTGVWGRYVSVGART